MASGTLCGLPESPIDDKDSGHLHDFEDSYDEPNRKVT
jgi:hypothetical protein